MSEIIRYQDVPIIPVEEVPNGKKILTQCRIDTLLGFPFAGFLVMHTDYFFTDVIPTAMATTIPTRRVYINPEFFLKTLTNRKQRSFVLCHETLHIALDHIGRQIDRSYNGALWNIATDYAINGFLKDPAFPELEMPTFGLWRNDFVGFTADKIYHLLLDENGGDTNKAIQNNGGDPFGDGEGEGAGGFDAPRPFDQIGSEKGSKEEELKNRSLLNAAIAEQHKRRNKKIGTGAASLIEQLEEFLKPKIPWQTLLYEYITSKSTNRSTYNRLSRRSTSTVVFPSMTGDNINLAFGVDTSGSMGNSELQQALGGLYQICEGFDSWNVTLLTCDTKAHVIGEYNSDEGDDFKSISREWVGGGGTSLEDMITMPNSFEGAPDVIVIITDGHIPEAPMDKAATESDIPVIVIVTQGGNQELKLNHCQVVFIEDVEG